MFLLILYLPALSFLFCCFWGRGLGYKGVKTLPNILLGLSCLTSVLIFKEVVVYSSNYNLNMLSWFDLGLLHNSFTFHIDAITSSMLILVTSVSFLVHLFSISYMDGDPHLPRFMSYLSLFTFFMIILVTANNLIQLFIGWEGVGLCSYLLINFWYSRIQANKAAIKAMVINKIGDVGLLLGIIMLWFTSGSLSINTVIPLSGLIVHEQILNWVNFLLLIGVIGKSAQIGLHMWLPDAMEGPTPVSALIHAATMVTAGVFLIIRVSPLFEKTPFILLLVILLGSLTAFLSATIGLVQSDLKKVIAYSTCSQLGYMVLICGFSHYDSGLFHLVNHGFFKALLFLSAGSVIHAVADEQDMRRMGHMKTYLPLSYSCVFIGSISLMGLPFLTGFYSKDLLIELLYFKHYLSFSLWLGLGAAFLTAFYSCRLIFLSFIARPQFNRNIIKVVHEGSLSLITPLIILTFCSVSAGFLFQNFLLVNMKPVMIPTLNKFYPLVFSLGACGIFLTLVWLVNHLWILILKPIWLKLYSLFVRAWYFDQVLNRLMSLPVLRTGFGVTYKLLDNQLLEVLGPKLVSNKLPSMSNSLSNYHSGRMASYTFGFLFFVLLFMSKL